MPFTKNVIRDVSSSDGQRGLFYHRHWNTQAKPYKKPLEYHFERKFNKRNEGNLIYQLNTEPLGNPCSTSSGVMYPYSNFPTLDNPLALRACNKALAKWEDKLSAEANFAETIAQYRQAGTMLTQRLTSVLEIVTAILRRDFHKFVDAIAHTYDPRSLLRKRARTLTRQVMDKNKNLADIWLELHFGVVPVIKDCQALMEILETDFLRPPFTVKAGVFQKNTYDNGSYGDPSGAPGTFYGYENSQVSQSYRCLIGGSVRIVSPNLNLASRLGLINPFLLGYNLIPFSFLVDWVSNTSQWVSSWIPNFGVEVDNPFYTVTAKRKCTYRRFDRSRPGGAPADVGDCLIESEQLLVKRQFGHPQVTLQFNPIYRLSLSKGLTAIALLNQRIRAVR
jgi:hypothetical protein